MINVKIVAWKPNKEPANTQTSCDKNDPDATSFEVHYPGMKYSSSALEVDSLFKAELLAHAFVCCYSAGKSAAKKEFRDWIGG